REALLQLQGEGIIDMRAHKGAAIPHLDERYVDNVYRLRGAIQSMLARDAATRATASQIRQLAELARAHEDAVASGDAAQCVSANRAFHRHLDGIADNAMALEVLESRNCLVDAYRRAQGYGTGRLDKVVAQHRKMVRAITRRDGEAAARAALEHTESSREDLLNLVRRNARP
ncbi:MAG: GntR family transcriptional regulator, partial [Betaproteobacteria bacterium]